MRRVLHALPGHSIEQIQSMKPLMQGIAEWAVEIAIEIEALFTIL
jgi:hypothetical protein